MYPGIWRGVRVNLFLLYTIVVNVKSVLYGVIEVVSLGYALGGVGSIFNALWRFVTPPLHDMWHICMHIVTLFEVTHLIAWSLCFMIIYHAIFIYVNIMSSHIVITSLINDLLQFNPRCLCHEKRAAGLSVLSCCLMFCVVLVTTICQR